MWLNIKQLSSRPTFPWYGDYFKTSTILLEKSHCYYVLTNLLAETNCFVFRAYKLPSMDIVVIKIRCASYEYLLEAEARYLSQLLGVEGVQQLVEISPIVCTSNRPFYALVTTPFGIPLPQKFPSPLTKDEATDVALKVVPILKRIHNRNIVHSDIKPSNIIMVNNHPIIIDFGSARTINSYQAWSGTPEYAAIGSCKKALPFQDYESLVYTTIKLTCWLLPWHRDDDNMEEIKKSKTKSILHSFPSQFLLFVTKETNLTL